MARALLVGGADALALESHEPDLKARAAAGEPAPAELLRALGAAKALRERALLGEATKGEREARPASRI